MMPIWFEDPDGKPNRVNKTTMPHRNYVIITEHAGKATDAGNMEDNDQVTEGELGGKDAEKQADAQKKEKPDEDMRPAKWVTGGSGAASAAAPVSGTRRKYALDVSFRVEIDQKDVSTILVSWDDRTHVSIAKRQDESLRIRYTRLGNRC
jgi:hypothetical protein